MTSVQPTTGRTRTGIAWEQAGDGPPLVLVHSGVADRRMWDPMWRTLAGAASTVRYDIRGFGDSDPPSGPCSGHGDLIEVIETVARGPAVVVGSSLGGGLAVEATRVRPDLVTGLVLAAPGGGLIDEPGPELEQAWQAEEEALERGDLDEAVEVNLLAWVDGPARDPGAVDSDLRQFVGAMQRLAFEKPPFDRDLAPHESLEPAAHGRLGELHVPILVILGTLDAPGVNAIGERVAHEVPSATLERWPDVGHMLPMERPDAFAQRVLRFVNEIANQRGSG